MAGHDRYDVVVGGGAAGLSGALALARARRRVLVVDAGTPRDAPAAHVHNVLGHDGTPPARLLAAGRREVEGYGGEVVDGHVTALHGPVGDYGVDLADGSCVRARRLLLATGLTDELPAVPGMTASWGSSVLHCPYCHGWEVRDRAVAVLGLVRRCRRGAAPGGHPGAGSAPQRCDVRERRPRHPPRAHPGWAGWSAGRRRFRAPAPDVAPRGRRRRPDRPCRANAVARLSHRGQQEGLRPAFPLVRGLRSRSLDWTRTSNRPINSRMLCQLSYEGSCGKRL